MGGLGKASLILAALAIATAVASGSLWPSHETRAPAEPAAAGGAALPIAARKDVEHALEALDQVLRFELDQTEHPWAIALCLLGLGPRVADQHPSQPLARIGAAATRDTRGLVYFPGTRSGRIIEPEPNAVAATLLKSGVAPDREIPGPGFRFTLAQLAKDAITSGTAAAQTPNPYTLDLLSFYLSETPTPHPETRVLLEQMTTNAAKQLRAAYQIVRNQMGDVAIEQARKALESARRAPSGVYRYPALGLELTASFLRASRALGDAGALLQARRFIPLLRYRHRIERAWFAAPTAAPIGEPGAALEYYGQLLQSLLLASMATTASEPTPVAGQAVDWLFGVAHDALRLTPAAAPLQAQLAAKRNDTERYFALLSGLSQAVRGLRFTLGSTLAEPARK